MFYSLSSVPVHTERFPFTIKFISFDLCTVMIHLVKTNSVMRMKQSVFEK